MMYLNVKKLKPNWQAWVNIEMSIDDVRSWDAYPTNEGWCVVTMKNNKKHIIRMAKAQFTDYVHQVRMNNASHPRREY